MLAQCPRQDTETARRSNEMGEEREIYQLPGCESSDLEGEGLQPWRRAPITDGELAALKRQLREMENRAIAGETAHESANAMLVKVENERDAARAEVDDLKTKLCDANLRYLNDMQHLRLDASTKIEQLNAENLELRSLALETEKLRNEQVRQLHEALDEITRYMFDPDTQADKPYTILGHIHEIIAASREVKP